jgi:hypoxia up-regulated 1
MLLGLFFLFSSTASAASAVLGVDMGTEYIKAALVKPGVPLEIVLTKDSRRKETSAVAFKPAKSGASPW